MEHASPGGAVPLDDAASLAFFDERITWQVNQFQGAMEGVEVRACASERERRHVTCLPGATLTTRVRCAALRRACAGGDWHPVLHGARQRRVAAGHAAPGTRVQALARPDAGAGAGARHAGAGACHGLTGLVPRHGCATAAQVFQERRQRALIVVVGEMARCDCVEDIAVDDIEEPEPCDVHTEPSFSRLITFWKPARRYQVRPRGRGTRACWRVR
jgi:hypothetical protein